MAKLVCSQCGAELQASKDRFAKLSDEEKKNYLCRECRSKVKSPKPAKVAKKSKKAVAAEEEPADEDVAPDSDADTGDGDGDDF